MRGLILSLALLAFLGCAKPVQEKDLVGVWKGDPASVPEGEPQNLIKNAVLNLTADHKFELDYQQFRLSGFWAFNSPNLSLDPDKIAMMIPGGQLEKSPEDLVKEIVPQLKKMPNGDKMAAQIEHLAETQSLVVGEDGKSLTSADKSVFRKDDNAILMR